MSAQLGDLADTPLDVIRRVVDVNLVGVLLCLRHAAQVMFTARGGAGCAIVTISARSPYRAVNAKIRQARTYHRLHRPISK